MDSSSCCYEAELDLLGSYFLGQREEKSYALFGGLSSSILVQSVLYQHTFDVRYKEAIVENVEALIGVIEKDESVASTFCNGLAGVGWLFLYLKKKDLIDIDPDDFLSSIDGFLVGSLDEFLIDGNLDFLHGALGVGLYFLGRKKIADLERIVNRLYEDGDFSGNELKWLKFDKRTAQDVYDFGLAHGHASTLYFLGRCWKDDILKDRCKEMIYGIFDFYFNNVSSCSSKGSFFPISLTKDEYSRDNQKDYFSRLAWCYGDLGILHTMFIVAGWLSDHGLLKRIEGMLVKLSRKRDLKENMLKDAQFCHGTSGVSYIFYNLYRLTKNDAFLLAADYWQTQTLLMGGNKNNEGTLGYLFDVGYSKQGNQSGILSGIGGVLISLISAKKIDVFDWNECFLLS